jgi:hypothetical protein
LLAGVTELPEVVVSIVSRCGFYCVSRFIITDLTLNMNYIHNFNDSTGALSAGVNYKNLSDFTAGCLLLGRRGRCFLTSYC